MSSAARSPILPGFADPVHDAQTCFRAVLDGMSRPGKAVTLANVPPVANLNANMPRSCLGGMVAIALTLCDADTPVWLDAFLDTPALRRHLRFHCGCSITSGPERASFALIGDPETMPHLERFFPGDPAYPDRAATLVMAADFSTAGPGRSLSGPGIPRGLHPQGALFGPAGLPAWFWEERAASHAGYPLGVDIIFVDASPSDNDPARIAALPRSTAAVPADRADTLSAKEKSICTSR